jgi:hypothetical protein
MQISKAWNTKIGFNKFIEKFYFECNVSLKVIKYYCTRETQASGHINSLSDKRKKKKTIPIFIRRNNMPVRML